MLISRLKSIDLSVNSRVVIWNGGLDIFKQYPILGAGAGCFRILFPEFRSPEYHLTQISNVTLWAHNRVIDLLAEHGILGSGLYLMFLGMVCWRGVVVIRHATDERLKVVAIALLSGLIAYFVTALFHPGIRWIIGASPYWAFLGMIVGVGELEKQKNETPVPGRRRRATKPVLTPQQYAIRACVFGVAILIWINPFPLSHKFLFSNFGYGIRYFQGAKANNSGLVLLSYTKPKAAEAAKFFREAVAWNPTFITSYYKWAHAENVMRNHEGSLNLYKDLMRYAPHYSEVHYNLGVINYVMASEKQKKLNAAKDAAAKKALREEIWKYLEASQNEYATAARMSKKVSVQYAYAENLAYNASYTDDPQKTKELRNMAAEIYHQIPGLKLTLATQEEGQRKKESALQEKAMRKAPDFFEAVKEWEKAAEACMRIYHKEPGNNKMLKRAVDNFRRAKDIKGARSALESALSRNTLNFEARNLLANVMLEKPKDPEARKEALKQSRILHTLSLKFPKQMPPSIQAENGKRLKTLQGQT